MMINSHFELSDNKFLAKFKNCSLPSSLFSHEAHLRLAWLMIKAHGVDKAVDQICTQIEVYVDHLGAADKYHKTLTVAAVKIVNHFILKSDADEFKDFITQNPRLLTEFKILTTTHYSENIFNSDLARSKYLEPDLLPFE